MNKNRCILRIDCGSNITLCNIAASHATLLLLPYQWESKCEISISMTTPTPLSENPVSVSGRSLKYSTLLNTLLLLFVFDVTLLCS